MKNTCTYVGTLDELVMPPPGAGREGGSIFDNVKGMLLRMLKQGLHIPGEHRHTRFARHLWVTPRDDRNAINAPAATTIIR